MECIRKKDFLPTLIFQNIDSSPNDESISYSPNSWKSESQPRGDIFFREFHFSWNIWHFMGLYEGIRNLHIHLWL